MIDAYLGEILEQPAALHRAIDGYRAAEKDLEDLARRVQEGAFRQVILTGMGSSYYCCHPVWLMLSARGIPAVMWEASELIHYAPELLRRDDLVIAVSQSGESVEMRRLAELGNRPGLAVSVTNGTHNTLAGWADIHLDIRAGSEATVSTKTFVTELAVLHLLGCQLTGQDVAPAADNLRRSAGQVQLFLDDREDRMLRAADYLGVCESLAFIGRGPGLASAMTGALITREASKVFTVGLSAGQFRHGPLELVRPGFAAVVFVGDESTADLNRQLARDIVRLGGKVVVVASSPTTNPIPGAEEVIIGSAEPMLLPISEILPVQLLTIPLARRRGFEPGAFEHGHKVTATE